MAQKIDLKIVEWADRGGGFEIQRAGSTVPDAFWGAADKLRAELFDQPSETIGRTEGYPVWGMAHVPVAGFGEYWCFTVQGIGQPFGAAGTCRFGFIPGTLPAARAWVIGRQHVAETDEPSGQAVLTTDDARVLLKHLIEGKHRARAGADPQTAAALIEVVLPALPHAVVKKWTWTTCPLQKPRSRTRSVVAGVPPAAFRSSHTMRRLAEEIEGLPVPSGEVLADQIDKRGENGQYCIKGLEILIGQVSVGEYPNLDEPATRQTDLISFLAEIAVAGLQMTIGNVRGLLASEPGRARLSQEPQLVVQWAGEDRKVHDDLRRKADNGPDSLLGQLQKVARQVCGIWPEFAEALARRILGQQVCEPARDLHWLKTLGLGPDRASELYPKAWFIARNLQSEGRLNGLGIAPEEFHEVGGYLDDDWLQPDLAANLLRSVPHEAVRAWALAMTRTSKSVRGADRIIWLTSVLKQLNAKGESIDLVWAVLDGGRAALGSSPTNPKFDAICGTIEDAYFEATRRRRVVEPGYGQTIYDPDDDRDRASQQLAVKTPRSRRHDEGQRHHDDAGPSGVRRFQMPRALRDPKVQKAGFIAALSVFGVVSSIVVGYSRSGQAGTVVVESGDHGRGVGSNPASHAGPSSGQKSADPAGSFGAPASVTYRLAVRDVAQNDYLVPGTRLDELARLPTGDAHMRVNVDRVRQAYQEMVSQHPTKPVRIVFAVTEVSNQPDNAQKVASVVSTAAAPLPGSGWDSVEFGSCAWPADTGHQSGLLTIMAFYAPGG